MKCTEEVWYFAAGHGLHVDDVDEVEAKRVFGECVSKIDVAFAEAFGHSG